MPKDFSPKQIERYKRQKLLGAINKCTKNLYKIFKDNTSTYCIYKEKFIQLKKEIEKYKDVLITNDYVKRVNSYIDNLYRDTIINEIDEDTFQDLKESEATNLNRLQKSKNSFKYKKDKYKSLHNEW